MIHKQIEFHNVAELQTRSVSPGLFLSRYPTKVCKTMTQLGQIAARVSSGVELRFVTDAEWANITLSAHNEYPWASNGTIDLYKGDYFCGRHTVPEGQRYTLKLSIPPLLRELTLEAGKDARFSPDVWRLVLGNADFVFHELNNVGRPVRPPQKDEKPALRWLAYGSSITNAAPDGYVQHAARFLGVDLLNKGLCGSCFCEPETARHLAKNEQWDFATLELGVNMRWACTGEDFARRAAEFISIFRRAQPQKPIVLLTMFPNSDDFRKTPTQDTTRNREYRQALRDIVTKAGPRSNLHLIEGDQILTRFTELCSDGVHPAPFGHILMAHNLAPLLQPLLRKVPPHNH